MKRIEDQITSLRADITDLEQCLQHWDNDRQSKPGGARYRQVAERIVASAKTLKALVKENTFPAR